MFPTDPRALIAHIPFVVDSTPSDCLMIAGLSKNSEPRYIASFPLDVPRPLDEPLLESSLWGDDIARAAVVSFSDRDDLSLQPLIDAWGYRGRDTVGAVWAGPFTWRDYLCERPGCCTGAPHRYSAAAPHPRPDFMATVTENPRDWRRQRWDEWRQAIDQIDSDDEVDSTLLERLAQSLFDIPLRDAVLAQSAAPGEVAQPAITAILESIAARSVVGTAAPAYTCLAAMYYLESSFDACGGLVREILEVEEYSFARLLQNGLEMRAPASLLARSFATFNPQDLLAA